MPEKEDINSIPYNLEIKEDGVPDGPALLLNSKWLNVTQIRRLAAAIDVPTGAAGDEVHQMLGEKLEAWVMTQSIRR